MHSEILVALIVGPKFFVTMTLALEPGHLIHDAQVGGAVPSRDFTNSFHQVQSLDVLDALFFLIIAFDQVLSTLTKHSCMQ